MTSSTGYINGLFAKWHLGTNNNLGGVDAPRISGGWDHYQGRPNGGGIGNYYDWNKTTNGVTDGQAITNYATTENVDDAILWINQQSGPWTCTMAFNAPHSPYVFPPNNLHSF